MGNGFAALSIVLSLGVLLVTPAGARKFQMSGIWISRENLLFLPLQFVDPVGVANSTNASMGDLTEGLGYPNGPIPGAGVVTATGSSPATLRIPAHRFVEDAMALVPRNDAFGLIQITTNVGIDAPYAAATLVFGGGPGGFTWCPKDPACIAGGGMTLTDPPQGAGPRNGRVIYRAGANRFGGVMQLGLRRGGVASFPFGSVPGRVGHVLFTGVGATLRKRAVGGGGPPDVPAIVKVYLPRGFATQPTMFPPIGSPIRYPGPKVTTMLGVTTTGTGAVFYLPVIATGPMGTKASRFTTRYGFAHTTGTVIAQQTQGTGAGTSDFFTVTGSDARTNARGGQHLAGRRGRELPQYGDEAHREVARDLREADAHARAADPVALAGGRRGGYGAGAAGCGLCAAEKVRMSPRTSAVG